MIIDLTKQDIKDILLAIRMNYKDGPEDTEHAIRLQWLITFFTLLENK